MTKQSRTTIKRWTSSLGLGKGLTTHCKDPACYEPQNWQALVNMVMKLRVPQKAGNCLTS